jgi:MFS transporter, DHA2 family, multidrug resistance protein
LIPLFLQQLMGYNAMLAGLALAPGGVATLISMPTAGKLVTKVNPKWVLVSGLFITVYSTFLMAGFNLSVNFDTVVWSRVVMGIGMGLVFIPLISMTLSTIKKEEMGNATSVFNLLRNLGGSFGVAFVTTLLAQRSQFHQLRFGEHLNPFDARYQLSAHKAMALLQSKGAAAVELGKNGVIYQELIRQSTMAAYVDAFYVSTLILLCILPLVVLLKRPRSTDATISL